MKVFLALAAATFLGTAAAHAEPALYSVATETGTPSVAQWYSVCVGNTELEAAVKVQYRYGAATEWKDVEIRPNTYIIFSQRTSGVPASMTVKFKPAAGAEDVSRELEETGTLLRPRSCNGVESYRFEATDAGTIDLVHGA